MRRSLFVVLMLGCAVSVAAQDIGPVASVAGGKIRGRLLPAGGSVFRGIPFAQPPVGELRWREPQPAQAWPGVRDAGESGPPCAQNSSGWNERESIASREDCLYLDVWTPEWPAKARKPVMVWLHGGGNTGGAGAADPLYEGTRMVSRGVVLVIIDYRLGVFGFFAHPELTRESPHRSSGNYGLLDQIAALQWVRDNIAALGGDPGNVTVFGQSAGAADLAALMASPLAKGLFHKGIAESGGAGRSPALAQAEQAGVRLAEKLKAPAAGALPYLRSLSTAALLGAGSGGGSVIADGWVLPASPGDAFAAGSQHKLPLIIGTNAIEFSTQRSADDLRKAITATYGDLAPKALALYGLAEPGSTGRVDPVYGSPSDQWSVDTGMRCSSVLQVEGHSDAGGPTWQYEFDRAIPPKPTVVHSSELPYVFGNLFSYGSQAGQYTEVDRTLSDAVQAYWTNFAKTGDPNGPGLPTWPKFDRAARRFMRFGLSGEVAADANQRGDYCAIYIENAKRARPVR